MTKTREKECKDKEMNVKISSWQKMCFDHFEEWVLFLVGGSAFAEIVMVCHQVWAGVGHSLCLQEHSHLLWAEPHDPHEAQKWVFLH